MGRTTLDLGAITVAKRAYDAQVQAIDAEAKAKKQQAKGPLFEVIRSFLEAGASVNSVSTKGLGYANITGMAHLLGASGTRVEALLEALGSTLSTTALPTSTGFMKYSFREDSVSSGTFYVTDSTGAKRTLYTDREVVDYGTVLHSPDKDDIIASFKAQFGDRFKYQEDK